MSLKGKTLTGLKMAVVIDTFHIDRYRPVEVQEGCFTSQLVQDVYPEGMLLAVEEKPYGELVLNDSHNVTDCVKIAALAMDGTNNNRDVILEARRTNKKVI